MVASPLKAITNCRQELANDLVPSPRARESSTLAQAVVRFWTKITENSAPLILRMRTLSVLLQEFCLSNSQTNRVGFLAGDNRKLRSICFTYRNVPFYRRLLFHSPMGKGDGREFSLTSRFHHSFLRNEKRQPFLAEIGALRVCLFLRDWYYPASGYLPIDRILPHSKSSLFSYQRAIWL